MNKNGKTSLTNVIMLNHVNFVAIIAVTEFTCLFFQQKESINDASEKTTFLLKWCQLSYTLRNENVKCKKILLERREIFRNAVRTSFYGRSILHNFRTIRKNLTYKDNSDEEKFKNIDL